ncbi:craniofacial development protein 2-like [Amphiura filiformis]|uniref:craniofacial development protein 2-like n=1 Tax=Amphiura filiformis TaxID=82378 RepID=UPI003B226301
MAGVTMTQEAFSNMLLARIVRPPGLKVSQKLLGRERTDGICLGINDAVTLKPQGGVKADNPKENARRNLWKSTLKIATWNVRTMNLGKLDILTNELERNDVHLTGISEMRWTGKGHFTTLSKHVVYYSGTESKREHGVAFVVNEEVAKCVLGYNPINERIITIRIQGKPMNMSVIQAYAPTSASSDEEIQQFYDQLQQAIDSIHKRDILVVTGDFNAKVGARSTNKYVMGSNGLGEQNERERCLLTFAKRINLQSSTPTSNNTQDDYIPGHHQIKAPEIRLITSWYKEDGNLVSYLRRPSQERTVDLITNF